MVSPAELAHAAMEVRNRAYVPYSGYRVGAALATDLERVVTGCNVENLSFGATICAERTAVTRMIAEGSGSSIVQLAVASEDGVAPCGICLQVLQEFVRPETLVHLVDAAGRIQTLDFRALLPHAFASDKVGRTQTDARSV
jgi:cytidine deaminase